MRNICWLYLYMFYKIILLKISLYSLSENSIPDFTFSYSSNIARAGSLWLKKIPFDKSPRPPYHKVNLTSRKGTLRSRKGTWYDGYAVRKAHCSIISLQYAARSDAYAAHPNFLEATCIGGFLFVMLFYSYSIQYARNSSNRNSDTYKRNNPSKNRSQ